MKYAIAALLSTSAMVTGSELSSCEDLCIIKFKPSWELNDCFEVCTDTYALDISSEVPKPTPATLPVQPVPKPSADPCDYCIGKFAPSWERNDCIEECKDNLAVPVPVTVPAAKPSDSTGTDPCGYCVTKFAPSWERNDCFEECHDALSAGNVVTPPKPTVPKTEVA